MSAGTKPFVVATIAAAVLAGPRWAAAAQQGEPEVSLPSHPCLLVTTTTLARLRQKATNGTPNQFGFDTRSAWQTLKAKADRFVKAEPYSYSVDIPLSGNRRAGVWSYTLSDQTPPRHDDSPQYPPWTAMFQERADSITTRLVHLSLAYLVTGEEPYFSRARTIALHLANWDCWTDPSYGGGKIKACLDTGHCTSAVAMFYDWCHDRLAASERNQLRQAIVEKGIQACLAGVDRYPPDTNGFTVVLGGAAFGAAAVWPDEPRAESWLRTCIAKARVSLDRGGKDGGAFEGPMYGTYLLDSLVKALEALDSSGIEHDLFEHPYLATMDRACIGMLAPDTNRIPCFGDGSPTAGYPQLMSVLAHRGSREAAWYLQQTEAVAISSVYDFIRFDAQRLRPRRPEWNPSTVLADIGYASLRDGFNPEVPSLFFKAGPYRNNIGHNHYDQNSFVISYAGEWVVPDRGYHSRYDPHERKFSLGSMGHCTIVLDADDAYLGRDVVPDPGHDQVKRTGGRITEHFAGSAFDFVKGEAAGAYNSPDRKVLDRFERSIVYIKPHAFVVHDRLAAPEPHAFSFLLHADGLSEINVEGNEFTLNRIKARVLGRVLCPSSSVPRVETFPGAERYGPYLRVETEPVSSTSFTAVLCPCPNPNPAFLRNGSFESGMAGWRPRANQDMPNHTIVEDNPAEGSKCARIERSGYYYSTKFGVAEGTSVTARARIRTSGVPADKGATMTLYFWRKGKSFAHKRVGPFAHDEWAEHSVSETVPGGTEEVCLALEFFAPGVAWFDDARFEADVPINDAPAPQITTQGPSAVSVAAGGVTSVASFGDAGVERVEGRLRTDAELAVVCFDTEGTLVRAFLKNGRLVAVDGRVVLELERPGTLEAVWDGEGFSATVQQDLAPHAPRLTAAQLTTAGGVRTATVNGVAARVEPDGGRTRITLPARP